MIIDNSSTLWNNNGKDNDANDNGIDDDIKEELFGVRSSGTGDKFNINTIQIANSDFFAGWEFMNSDGISFQKLGYFEDTRNVIIPKNRINQYESIPYYAIYNYGHYIAGYTINYGDMGLSYNGEKWSDGETNYTEIDILTSTYLPELARALDEYMLQNNLTSIKTLPVIVRS